MRIFSLSDSTASTSFSYNNLTTFLHVACLPTSPHPPPSLHGFPSPLMHQSSWMQVLVDDGSVIPDPPHALELLVEVVFLNTPLPPEPALPTQVAPSITPPLAPEPSHHMIT